MLRAFDLEPHLIDCDDLNRNSKNRIQKGQTYIFIEKRGQAQAVVLVNVSDVGLNLSSLTNCMHFFAVDEEGLTYEDFDTAISSLAGYYEENEIPVLIYPTRFVVTRKIPYEKLYNLWVLSMIATDKYAAYINNVFTNHVETGSKGD
jgi:hypothetical protein